MSPNGRRAWRRAAKKLRRKMGRRWRSPNKWSEKRWSELVPDLEAHRGHVTGAWFRRHGFAELDPRYKIRQYIGLWGTVDGDGVEYAVKPKSFTPRSLVGMTQGARKRLRRSISKLLDKANGNLASLGYQHDADRDDSFLRIGERLRPCPGCHTCMPGVKGWHIDKVRGRFKMPTAAWSCDGSGVLPARAKKVRR